MYEKKRGCMCINKKGEGLVCVSIPHYLILSVQEKQSIDVMYFDVSTLFCTVERVGVCSQIITVYVLRAAYGTVDILHSSFHIC